MVTSGRMQRIGFPIADLICAVVAFAIAYRTLVPARDIVGSWLAGYMPISDGVAAGFGDRQVPGWFELSWIFVVAALAVRVTLEYGNDAKPVATRSYRNIVVLQVVAICMAALAVATVCQALQVPLYSRLFVVSYLTYLLVLTTVFRICAKGLAERYKTDLAKRKVLVAGRAEGIVTFLSHAKKVQQGEADLVGCLIDGSDDSNAIGIPILGRVASLGDVLIHQPIDEVMIVLPKEDTAWVPIALEHCDYFRVSVHLVPESLMSLKMNDLMSPDGVEPFASIVLRPEEELSSDWLVLKRLIDIVGSVIALIVLSPIMLLIAIAIKITTPHLPVFYRWNVVGYRGRRFTGYKFTTMIADADARKADLNAQNEMSGPVFKMKNDPRVTPLGRFLRKYSLNELPQFWSVLVGDMSLVGPRPAGPHELVKYSQWHKRKLSVRPGITCFWQVRGRNAISSFDDWVRMDLEYIQKRSVRTDVAILLQTVSAVVRGTGS